MYHEGDPTAVLRSIRRREVEHTISMMYGKRPPMQQLSTDRAEPPNLSTLVLKFHV